MKSKKLIFASAVFLLSASQVFSTTICRCRLENGTSLTTYGYAVDSNGCCSGTVNEFWGGQQLTYELGNDGVWALTSSNAISATSAQQACCPPT